MLLAFWQSTMASWIDPPPRMEEHEGPRMTQLLTRTWFIREGTYQLKKDMILTEPQFSIILICSPKCHLGSPIFSPSRSLSHQNISRRERSGFDGIVSWKQPFWGAIPNSQIWQDIPISCIPTSQRDIWLSAISPRPRYQKSSPWVSSQPKQLWL